ncbi:MAG: recombinase family protein [Candidatus Xenobiia bacterium LiM19]
MKILGYIRVSTEEQATSGCSLSAQAEKIRAYAELYELTLIDILEDPGQSGKSLERPSLRKALEMLKNGMAKGILVTKLDRLTRSVSDMDYLIREYFGDKSPYEATLFSVADQVDTRTASGRLVLNVLMSVAQWERETIGERTKAALDHLKAQGKKLGAPFLGETEEEKSTIRFIYQMRDQGYTLQRIADTLNCEGWKTKKGGNWHSSTVFYALKQNISLS